MKLNEKIAIASKFYTITITKNFMAPHAGFKYEKGDKLYIAKSWVDGDKPENDYHVIAIKHIENNIYQYDWFLFSKSAHIVLLKKHSKYLPNIFNLDNAPFIGCTIEHNQYKIASFIKRKL